MAGKQVPHLIGFGNAAEAATYATGKDTLAHKRVDEKRKRGPIGAGCRWLEWPPQSNIGGEKNEKNKKKDCATRGSIGRLMIIARDPKRERERDRERAVIKNKPRENVERASRLSALRDLLGPGALRARAKPCAAITSHGNARPAIRRAALRANGSGQRLMEKRAPDKHVCAHDPGPR